MIRGTTPKHIFKTALPAENIKNWLIVYAQDKQVILKKRKDDCELSGSTITVRLTQEDTLKFECGKSVQIQIKVLTTSGDVFASFVDLKHIYTCLDDEVLE